MKTKQYAAHPLTTIRTTVGNPVRTYNSSPVGAPVYLVQ